jgi:hypothetical protein
MAAGHCAGCGEAGEPGECDSCGAQVPVAEESSELAASRRAALASLLARAEELRRGCDAELRVGARVTADQLAGAIVQSGISDLIADVGLACQRLSAFDFDDPRSWARGCVGPYRKSLTWPRSSVT